MAQATDNLLAAVWGDAASVLGFLIAVWALVTAGTARSAVERVVRRNNLMLSAMEVAQAIETARLVLATTRRDAWDVDRDSLRDRLASFRQHPYLAWDEQKRVRSSIVDLTRLRFQDDAANSWTRDLIDFLIALRRRLIDLSMEQ